MRALSYILAIVGLWTLASAGYQQYHGITTEPVMMGNGSLMFASGEIARKSNPDGFHNAMTIHWVYGCLIVSSALILHLIIRGQDRTDPLSPNFDWKDEEKP
jgi:hypothetical protein